MKKEIKVFLTTILGFLALMILMKSCTPKSGYYDSYGHYHPYRSSSFFFWGGGRPSYWGNTNSYYNNQNRNYSNRQGSVNNNRYYGGQRQSNGSYRMGK